MPFDWGKFNRTIKKKPKTRGGKKPGGGGKGNAWRAYIRGGKKK